MRLLQSHKETTQFKIKEKTDFFGKHVWIIHVVGKEKQEKALEILRNSPISFDSNIFEFFQPIEGKSSKCLTMSYLSALIVTRNSMIIYQVYYLFYRFKVEY